MGKVTAGATVPLDGYIAGRGMSGLTTVDMQVAACL
jgi:hypothetical protein